MPHSGNTKLIARCCADFAGDIAADPEAIKAAVTACLAGGGLAVGGLAAAPVVVPLVLFVGLNALLHGIEKRDNKKADADLRAFLDALFNTLQSDVGDVDALLTETYIGQQIESQDLRERLSFISEIVKQNSDTAETLDARTGRIEQMLINHPDHTARFEHVLKEHYQALGGKLDENQQGIVFTAFGNELLYLGQDEIKRLIVQEHEKTRAQFTEDLGRAKDEILNAMPDGKSLTAPPRLPQPTYTFIGRAEEQQQLLAAIRGGGENKVAGIAGVRGQGGIGKTALALSVGHQLAAEFPDGQVYIDLRGTTEQVAPRAAMESILREFDKKTAFKDATDDQLAAHYRSTLAPKRALLLLDNAAEAKQVLPLIPGGSCGVLVTARKRFKIGHVDPLRLDLLSEPDAIALIQNNAPHMTDGEARELAEACGYLALAVHIASVHISLYDDRTAAQHIADLKSDRLAYLDAVEPDDAGDTEGLRFAHRAIQLSLDRLPPGLQAFWARLSVFPVDFNAGLAVFVASDQEVPDIDQGRQWVSELRRHALLEFDDEDKRYRLHDLSREFAWKRALADDVARFELSKRHATVFRDLLGAADQQYREGKVLQGLILLDCEMPSILNGFVWAKTHMESDEIACRLAADYFDVGAHTISLRMHSRDQITWLETAISACRKLGDRIGEVNARGNLGIAHAALGDTRKAIEHYEQTLAFVRENGDRKAESSTLGNLGNAYDALGDARQAVDYHEQALAISREIGDRRGEGQDLGNLGLAHASLRDYRKANDFYEQQLKIVQEIGDRRGEGNAMGNLGLAHASLGDNNRAIEYYEQQLKIVREIGDRRGEQNAIGNLGNAHAALGNERKAIEYYQQTLTISREIGDRRGEGNARGNLGSTYAKLGNNRKAIEYYEQALAIFREIGDRQAENSMLDNLGYTHARLGDARKAYDYFEQRIIFARETGDHQCEGKTLFNRALVQAHQEDWCPAAEDMERASALFTAIKDPDAAEAAQLANAFHRRCQASILSTGLSVVGLKRRRRPE